MGTILTEIITLLTSGFTTFAAGIGTGLNQYVGAMFIETGAEGAQSLTVFGGLVVIFAAISLTMGLSRWVLNFITSLGGRNQ